MRGFTLIDALLTVILCGIVLCSLLPNFQDYTAIRELKAATKRLANDLENLAARALQYENEFKLKLYSSYYKITRKSGELLSKVAFKQDINSNNLDHTSQTVTFYPSGVASPKTLTLKSHKHVCSITISLRGRILTNCPIND